MPGRMKGRKLFEQVLREGRSVSNRSAALYLLSRRDEGQEEPARVGYAAGRRAGTAPERNRIRRRLREAVRRCRGELPQGADLVFIGRRWILDSSWPEVEASVRQVLSRVLTSGEPESRPK
jgi:ribonuclease P protein component